MAAAGESTTARKRASKQAEAGMSAEDRSKALKAAYNAATVALRQQFQGEFNALYQSEAAKRNVEWTPKPSAEEKAARDFDALLEQYPFLAHRVANPEGAEVPDEEPDDGSES